MKTHKELKIPNDKIDEILKCDYSERFSRDKGKEETLHAMGESQYCINYQLEHDEVSIWLKSRREYCVITNILADERDIDVDEYNSIVDEFFTAISYVGGVKITSGVSTLRDSLPADIVYLLEIFLHHCNADYPFSHPFDCKRWANFIKACATNGYKHIDADEFDEFVANENASIDITKNSLYSHYGHDVEMATYILEIDGDA